MALIRIGNDEVSVEVSSLGAEMQSLVTADGQNWLWDGDAAFWSGRSPVLFPIVGKAPGDHLSVEGQRYPMGQHGFARRNEFELVAEEADWCRMELRASAATKAIYPFDFVLAVEHRVEGRAVSVTAEVNNADNRPMPFGIGFHPAFVWPLPGCGEMEHRVVLDDGGEPEMLRLSGGLMGTHKLPSPFSNGALTLKHHLFDADAMIFPEGAGAGVTYAAKDRAVHFTWDNLPNFAIWSKPGAPFVCLEPWRGMAAEAGASDAIEERPYTEVLGPGAMGRYGFRAELVG